MRDDLKDPVVRQPCVARADSRLGYPELSGDSTKRLAPVPLEGLDDLPVELVDPLCRPHWAAAAVAARDETKWVAVGSTQCRRMSIILSLRMMPSPRGVATSRETVR